jgi:hypothetical protein
MPAAADETGPTSGGGAGRTLLFLHVPKAGGTALGGVLANRFAADDCVDTYEARRPTDTQVNAARFMTGHVSMSALERFERPPFSITVLREPIARALSTYSFFRELEVPETDRPGLERHDAMVRLARRYSLDQLIESGPDLAEHYLGNWQARVLGAKRLDRTDERLEDALAGLRRCDFIGLAERQDESVDWLTHRLGWAALTPLPRAMVTRTSLREDEVSPAALEALRDLTAVDRELYSQAVRLYEDRVSEWSAAGGIDGPAAGIEDAPLVSDLRFDRPIRGSGWLGRERVGDEPWMCWIGHTGEAQVDLADDPGARHVVVEVAHAVRPEILETLRITVDGRGVTPTFAQSGDAVIASAPLEPRRGRRHEAVRVKLAVDHATRPCDVNPESSDNRELAIAVRRIALLPARAGA